MNRLLLAAKTALCLAGTALLLSACVLVARVDREQAQLAVKAGNDLDEAHRLILESGLTAMEARKASAAEAASLAQWNGQTTQLLANANTVLISLRQTSDAVRASQAAIAEQSSAVLSSANTAIAALPPDEAQLGKELTALTATTQDLGALVHNGSAPALATLANVQTLTGNAAAFSGDSEHLMHQLAYPPKKKRSAWGYIGSGARVLSWFVKLTF